MRDEALAAGVGPAPSAIRSAGSGHVSNTSSGCPSYVSLVCCVSPVQMPHACTVIAFWSFTSVQPTIVASGSGKLNPGMLRFAGVHITGWKLPVPEDVDVVPVVAVVAEV